MPLTSKILLFFVSIGAINIIILLIIKSKAKSVKKLEKKSKNIKGDIKILNYDDEDLICMVDNNLELEYGYGCNDKNILERMKKTHRNIYTLLWFETEITNGGLGEYFFSISNITIDYIEEALKDVGAYDLLSSYKKIMQENNIIEAIGHINKRDVEEYSNFMNQFDFSNFNDLYEKIDLRELMADYIRKNIIDFSDLSEEELRILKEIEKEKLMENS